MTLFLSHEVYLFEKRFMPSSMTMRAMKKQKIKTTDTERDEEVEDERDDEKPCMILQLPDHIILEIFSRIPINTVIQCKYVCKSWRRSLSDHEFSKSLFARTAACLFLKVYSRTPCRSRNTKRYHIPPNKHILANLESVSSPNNVVLKLSDPNALYNRLHSSFTGVMGSCNGFLCLFRHNCKIDAFIFNISNPITGESVPLPVNKEIGRPAHFGFGFSPISDVYKVVVFTTNEINEHRFHKRKQCRKLEVMVLTVGSGIWRRIGKVSNVMRAAREGVFHNGFLHWVCHCKKGYGSLFIRAFDVESERFKDLPMPPCHFHPHSIPQMRVLGGSLSVSDGRTFWVMKEYGVKKSWTKELEIGRGKVDPNGGYGSNIRDVEVLKFTEGKVLLLADNNLCLYTPETRTLVRVEIDGMPSGGFHFVADHIPSFVSPKDIIKDYVSKLRSCKYNDRVVVVRPRTRLAVKKLKEEEVLPEPEKEKEKDRVNVISEKEDSDSEGEREEEEEENKAVMADDSGGLSANKVAGQEEENSTTPFPEKVLIAIVTYRMLWVTESDVQFIIIKRKRLP
ncbi:F-box protein At3g07870-like [Rosa rugosa]|uniref:F-box protein At3g07870-like n=1 Tax=Rosa rugosa TaxID=74645 RepID=UPI002B4183BD|nr:F-box protein At3g07870-like [Rosa rugosa]